MAKADAAGKWRVKLDPMPASAEPRVLTISSPNPKSETQNQKSANVLVGEVWVCSGQSRMAWPLKQAGNSATEAPTANYPKLRMFTVTQKIHIVVRPAREIIEVALFRIRRILAVR